MSEREKILRYYRASGEGDLAARLLDAGENAQRNRKYKVSEFLDPHGYSWHEPLTLILTTNFDLINCSEWD